MVGPAYAMDKMFYKIYGFSAVRMAVYAAIAFVVSACQQETVVELFGSAFIDPQVTIDLSVRTVDGRDASEIVPDNIASALLSFRLTSNDGLYSGTWQDVNAYPRREPLRPGVYRAEAFYGSIENEGFDRPCIYGSRSVNLVSGESYELPLECRIANAVVSMSYTPEALAMFPELKAVLHSSGGIYLPYPSTEQRCAFLRPDDINVYVDLTTETGDQVDFLAAVLPSAQATTLYNVTVDASEGADGVAEVKVSFDDMLSEFDRTIRLTPEFLAATPPAITPLGFASGETLKVAEGTAPEQKTGFSVSDGSLRSLVLTTHAPALLAKGWPASIDLVTASSEILDQMMTMGLRLSGRGTSITEIDLSDAIRNMRSSGDMQRFSLIAEGDYGRTSGAETMNIDIEPVELSVIEISDVLMGVNVARMKVLSHGGDITGNLNVDVLLGSPAEWTPVEILSADRLEDNSGEWILTLKLPEIKNSSAEMRVTYCGEEKVRTTVDIVSPEFSFEADAYAKLAVLKISAEHPDLTEVIASMVNIYVNGSQTQLIARQPEKGIVIIGGLNENSDYRLTATLYDPQSAAGHFTAPVAIHTEKCSQLPDGSFEDVHDGLEYKNLPSGGRYSQNIVDIYNQQNYASYDYYLPKAWCNVNAKTFCTAASNHNTWYMQPSTYTITEAMDGSYAIAIQTTAWDVNGEAIPDYRQTGQPYVNYNRNIPHISHKAAGRLFIGSYSFDPATLAESYTEGMAFTSRPTAINGYYRFVPCVGGASDCGVVLVEVIGEVGGADIVISRTLQELPTAMSYTAFSAPLSYNDFGVKAKWIKVMLASSKNWGSIETESSSIITYPDPVSSTSLGGCLWIDNLTLSY